MGRNLIKKNILKFHIFTNVSIQLPWEAEKANFDGDSSSKENVKTKFAFIKKQLLCLLLLHSLYSCNRIFAIIDDRVVCVRLTLGWRFSFEFTLRMALFRSPMDNTWKIFFKNLQKTQLGFLFYKSSQSTCNSI